MAGGKSFTDIVGNVIESSLSELKDAMLKNTSATKGNNTITSNANKSYGEMFTALKTLNDNFIKEIPDIAKNLRDAVTLLQGKTSAPTGPSSNQPVVDAIGSLEKCLCSRKLNEQNKSLTKSFSRMLEPQFQKLINAITAIPSSSGTPPITPPTSPTSPTSPAPSNPNPSSSSSSSSHYTDYLDKYFESNSIKFLKFINNIRGNIERLFFGFGEKQSLYNMMFGEMGGQEVSFLANVREIAFEIKGITGDLKAAQDELTDIGQTVAITGKTRTEFMAQYQKNLAQGIQDVGKVRDITKQTLGFEKLLGMKAGDLNETFVDLAASGVANVNQTAAMGRGMQQVQRSTGLTGEHLKKAVDASKPFVQNLSKAATLTAASATNVMNIVANAQKLRVEDTVGKLLPAVTSSAELITQSSDQTKALLYNAAGAMGRIQELQLGTLTRSKKGIKELAMGMEKVLQSFGVRSMEEIENLPDEVKFRLNIQLKGAFGMELGEMSRTIQAFKESGKGLSEQLDEINQKRKLSLTMEEQTALAEKERFLKTNAAMSVLTGLSEAAKGAQDMNMAIANFSRRSGEFLDDVRAFGGEAGSTTQAVESSLREAVKNLNEGLSKAGEKPIQLDPAEIQKALGDKQQFDVLIQRLEQGNLRLQNSQKAAVDPTLKTANTLAQYNDFFRDQYAQPLLKGILNLVGINGAMAIALGLIAAEMTLLTATLTAQFGGNLKKLFDWKGAKSKSPTAPAPGPSPTAPAPGGGGGGGGLSGLLNFGMSWSQLGQAGAALAKMVVAISALGASLVLLGGISKVIIKGLNIDPIETAVNIGKIILGSSAIILEAGAAYVVMYAAMQAYGSYFSSANMKQTGLFAAKMIALATALTILGGGLLYLADKLLQVSELTPDKISNINKSLLGIITGLGIMVGFMAATALALMGLYKVALGLGIATPVALKTLAIISIALPILAAGILTVATLFYTVANYLLGVSGLSPDKVTTINEAIFGITAGMALLTGVMLGAAWALAALYPVAVSAGIATPGALATLAILSVILPVLASAVLALGIVLYKGLMWLAGVGDIDITEVKERTEQLTVWLDGMNAVLLRLLPIFAVIVGMAVLLQVAEKFGSTAGYLAASIAGVTGALFLMIPALLFLSKVIVGAANMMANSADIDPAQHKKMMDKINLILDSANMILLKLVPMMGLILGLSVLAALFPEAAIAVAVVAPILMLTMPMIIKGLLGMGLAIVTASQQVMGGATITPEQVNAITKTMNTVLYAVWEISKVAAALAGIATLGTVGLGIGLAFLWAYEKVIAGYVSVIQKLASTVISMETAFGSKTAEQMQGVAIKFQSLGIAMKAISESIDAFRSNTGFFGAKADYDAIGNDFMAARTGIEKIVKGMSEIALYVQYYGNEAAFKDAAKSFENMEKFSTSISKFMSTMGKLNPSRKVISLSNTMAEKKTLQKSIENYFMSIKEITEIPGRVKFDLRKLITTTEVFKSINSLTAAMSGGLENMGKSVSILQNNKAVKLDRQTLITSIQAVVSNVEAIIDSLTPVAGSKALYNAPAAMSALKGMTSVFTTFGTALDSFTKVAEKVDLMTSISNFWNFFSKQKSLLEKMQTVIPVQQANKKDKNNVVVTYMSTFSASLKQMLDNFAEIITAVTDSNFMALADKSEDAVKALGSIGPTLQSYSTSLQQFYDAAYAAFGDKQKIWFVVWKGEGDANKLAAWKNLGPVISAVASNLKTISLAFNTYRDSDITGLSSRITNAADSMSGIVDPMNSYAAKATNVIENVEKAKSNYAFLDQHKRVVDAMKKFEYIMMPHSLMINAIKTSIDYYFGKEGGTHADAVANFNQWNVNLNSWIDAISVIPGKISAAVAEIQGMAGLKLPTDEQQQSAINAITVLGKFGGEVSKQADSYVKGFTLTNEQKSAIVTKTTALRDVVKVLAELVTSYNQGIYVPAISPDGMLSEKNKENLTKSATTINGFLTVLGNMVNEIGKNDTLNAPDATQTLEKIKSLGTIMDSVKNVLILFHAKFESLTTVPKNSQGIAEGPSILDSIAKNAPLVGATLRVIGGFVGELKSAIAAVPDIANMKGFTEKIEFLGGAAETVSKTMKTVNEVLTILAETQVDGKTNYIGNVEEMIKILRGEEGKNGLSSVFKMIGTDIIYPLMNLTATIQEGPFKGKQTKLYAEDIKDASDTLNFISGAMGALNTLFQNMKTFRADFLILDDESFKDGDFGTGDAKTHLEMLYADMTKYEPAINAMVKFGIKFASLFHPAMFRGLVPEDIKDAVDIFDGVSKIVNALFGKDSGLFDRMKDIATNQLKLQNAKPPDPKTFMGPMRPEDIEKMACSATAQGFLDAAESLAKFVWCMRDPLIKIINFGVQMPFDPDEVKDAAQIISSMGDILRSLPDMLNVLKTNLPNILSSVKDINAAFAKETNVLPEKGGPLAAIFENTMKFMASIIIPTLQTFGSAENIQQVPPMIGAMKDLLVALAANLPSMVQSLSDILSMGMQSFSPEQFKFLENIFTITNSIAAAIIMGDAMQSARNLGRASGQIDIVAQALLELAQAFTRLNGNILDLSKVSNVLQGLGGANITASVSGTPASGPNASAANTTVADVQQKVQMNDQSTVQMASQVALSDLVNNTNYMIGQNDIIIGTLQDLNSNLSAAAAVVSATPNTSGNNDSRWSYTYTSLQGGNVQDAANFSGRKSG